jgi:PAB-dependent poly(A)-specific ribonuclease subunit 2
MAYSGTNHSEVIAAGGQNNILLLNIDRGTIVKQVSGLQNCQADAQEPTTEWYTKLRRGRVVCGATMNGNIAIIDPRIGLGAQNKVEGAHTGGIEDIDTQDNTILSCGWTFR